MNSRANRSNLRLRTLPARAPRAPATFRPITFLEPLAHELHALRMSFTAARTTRKSAKRDPKREDLRSHAPRDLEEQPAAERDAERPEDEGINDVGHQISSHASETNALPTNLRRRASNQCAVASVATIPS